MFDIVVFGATGFTGRLVVRYLSTHASGTTFAIAGRSREKLERIKQEENLADNVEILIADSSNEAQLKDLCSKTKGVITTVGPYDLYGEALFACCAKAGICYVDLTGEAQWLYRMYAKYTEDIKASKAIIIPSCGFDSIPSDLAAANAVRLLQDKLADSSNQNVGKVVGMAKMKGGFSGGTFQSLVQVSEQPLSVTRKVFGNPYSLSPHRGAIRRKYSLVENFDGDGFGALFPLSVHNEKIVYRSWGLSAATKAWGPKFDYRESMQVSSRFRAYLISFSVAIFTFFLNMSWTRALIKRYGPQGGTGPSEEEQKKGFFQVTTTAYSEDHSKQATCIMSGKGDPGYQLTSIMISEACLSAIAQQSKLSSLAAQYGALTPSCLGDDLKRRLEGTGLFSFAYSKEEAKRASFTSRAKL